MSFTVINKTSSWLFFTTPYLRLSPGVGVGSVSSLTPELLHYRALNRIEITPFDLSEYFEVRNLTESLLVNPLGQMLSGGATEMYYGKDTLSAWLPLLSQGSVSISPDPNALPPVAPPSPSPTLQTVLVAASGPILLNLGTYQAAKLNTSGGDISVSLLPPGSSSSNRISIKNTGTSGNSIVVSSTAPIDSLPSIAIPDEHSFDFLWVPSTNEWVII